MVVSASIQGIRKNTQTNKLLQAWRCGVVHQGAPPLGTRRQPTRPQYQTDHQGVQRLEGFPAHRTLEIRERNGQNRLGQHNDRDYITNELGRGIVLRTAWQLWIKRREGTEVDNRHSN